MAFLPPTNQIDYVLCEVLARHPGFRLVRSGLVNSVWFARIGRDAGNEPQPIDDLDIDLRDALDAHHFQLRSAMYSRDIIDLQVTEPNH